MVVEAVDRQELCEQFDRAIDDLVAALRDCPGELWEASMWHVPRTDAWVWPAPGTEPVPARTDESIQQFSAFWVVGYHCLWFLDFYVTADPSGFESPEYVRDGPEEMPWPADGAAPLTDRVFSKEALLAYADHGRRRVRERIESMPEKEFAARCASNHPHAGKTLRQFLDVNLAHVREHGGQMLAFIRKHSGGSRPLLGHASPAQISRSERRDHTLLNARRTARTRRCSGMVPLAELYPGPGDRGRSPG